MFRAKWAAIPLLAILMLSGCESFGGGPAAISRDGEDLLISLCSRLDAPSISGGVQTRDGWSTFIEAKTDATLPEYSVLRTGPLPEGFTGTFSRFKFDGVRAFSIKFEGSGKGQSLMSTFGGSGGVNIPQNGWLHTDGRITTTACGSSLVTPRSIPKIQEVTSSSTD